MPYDGLSDESLRQLAPSIFATHAGPKCSDRYAYLPSYQVVRELRNLDLVPVHVSEGRKKDPMGRSFAMHQITFRRKNDFAQAPELGELSPEILLLNSNDRTSPLAFDAGMLRAVCTNGMRTNDEKLGLSFKVRHTGKNRLDQLHAGMAMLIKNLDLTVEIANQWSKIQLTPFQADRFALKALDIKDTALSISPQALLTARRDADRGMDLWHVFNRVQENIMKGGVAGYTASGKHASLKKISTLAKDVDFNRSLWAAASELAAEIKPVSVAVR
jgi:hypothetical protein